MKGTTMNIVNLTPHDIIVAVNVDGEDVFLTFKPVGNPARVKTNNVQIGTVTTALEEFSTLEEAQFHIPVSHVVYEDVENLPTPQDGIIYIVSAIVATSCKDRADVVAPDTGATAIRGENGQIVAVRGFLKY